MSGTLAAAGLRISMLIGSIGRCLAAIALAYCAASAGTLTRKIMRISPIVSGTPMMPNGYATVAGDGDRLRRCVQRCQHLLAGVKRRRVPQFPNKSPRAPV